MRVTRFNDEVFYSGEPVVSVTREDLAWLKECAARNPRTRVRLCAHRDVKDRVHEMLIVFKTGTYVRPHKHLDKTESFHVVEGCADLVLFQDDGSISQVQRLGDAASGDSFFLRNEATGYHTLVVRSEYFIFHETTNGPFDPAGSVPAPWAPDDRDLAAGAAFLAKVSEAAGRFR